MDNAINIKFVLNWLRLWWAFWERALYAECDMNSIFTSCDKSCFFRLTFPVVWLSADIFRDNLFTVWIFKLILINWLTFVQHFSCTNNFFSMGNNAKILLPFGGCSLSFSCLTLIVAWYAANHHLMSAFNATDGATWRIRLPKVSFN